MRCSPNADCGEMALALDGGKAGDGCERAGHSRGPSEMDFLRAWRLSEKLLMAFGAAERWCPGGTQYLPFRGLCAGAGVNLNRHSHWPADPCDSQRLPRQLNAIRLGFGRSLRTGFWGKIGASRVPTRFMSMKHATRSAQISSDCSMNGNLALRCVSIMHLASN